MSNSKNTCATLHDAKGLYFISLSVTYESGWILLKIQTIEIEKKMFSADGYRISQQKIRINERLKIDNLLLQ